MMGIGRRFSDAGYTEKKPFIHICGKPVIERVVEPLLQRFDQVYIVCTNEDSKVVERIFKTGTVIPIIVDESRGASQTIYEACKFLESCGYSNEPLLSIDCDTILNSDGVNKIVDANKTIIYSFNEPNKNGMYCYIKTDGTFVKAITEKDPVSTTAGAGVYQFSSICDAKAHCKSVLESIGEIYLSDAYKTAIAKGTVVETVDISDLFDCVGTPYQLRQFSSKIDLTDKVFCFDIDRTLVYDITESELQPIEKNVSFLRHVYQNGGKVILHTARGMLSRKGDIERIERELRPLVEKNLKKLDIPYHELIMGKPYADFYIDDKGYSSYSDVHNSTGIYLPIDTQPRNHHKIKVSKNVVTKTGDLETESAYYENLPKKLLSNFPTLISISPNTIEMEYDSSPTYSALLINGRLTESHLERMMDTINSFHTYPVDNFDIAIDWAYKHKMRERFSSNLDLYEKIELDSYFGRLNDIADSIKSGTVGIIHGDTVFTNIFESGKLIDPRGKWENDLTIYGDIEYDYAKILQSLNGYDYALNDMHINENYLNRLRWKFFDICKSEGLSIDRIIRKSIIIMASMIPFHNENLARCKRFSKIVKGLVDEYEKINTIKI